ncbi:uncharacterized protein LOC132196286 isoform X2 [Neocloeon triangulifer]|uniref:uncharacterized protein LOC132196286 isoform X2 n=1 Tax=Neocloeon triangulifer TaxID=2078957 RepID=UPI00286EDF75|nr:uncharacterized protein LOC132196286 isoform X2 [Neocloeon triangulifer]
MASELLMPSPTHESFPRGSALLMADGYRPRYNKSLDSLDTTVDAPAATTNQPAAKFYQAGAAAARKSEDNILGLTSPALVTQYLNVGADKQANTPHKFEQCVAQQNHHQGPSRLLCDRVDPEDSIRDMVSENDFYRFVLFKRHYDKYLRLSQKYEEARNIAYYLEEKYHEIKGERDELAKAREELERRVEQRDAQLLDKDEELFLQLEKVVRLEEECDKLRAEKERFLDLQQKLQAERDAALRQMRAQAGQSEFQRRNLERARFDAIHQATLISAEKNMLEKENERLRRELEEERQGIGNFLEDLSEQKSRASQSVAVLEKELSELQVSSQQTAMLNSQFKKAMKHLATCKRKKCSVCSYTKATFGDYADRFRHQRKLFSCIQAPLEDLRQWIRPSSSMDKHSLSGSQNESEEAGCSLDHEDLLHSSPTRAPAVSGPSGLSYIDSDESSESSEAEDEEVSTTSYDEEEEDEEEQELAVSSLPTDVSLTSNSTAARAFSSDSGFSSELCDSKTAGMGEATPSPPPKTALNRSKWTASFRKLIHRVSKR